MKKQGPKPPILPRADAGPSPIAELLDEDHLRQLVLVGTDLSYQQAKGVSIEEARMSSVRFAGSVFEKMSLRDARLETCDLSNTDWKLSRWTRVEIVNARLTGLKAGDGKFSSCKFIGCIGQMIQFQTAQFEDCVFDSCIFAGADFRFCNLESVVFLNCDLTQAMFYEAKLNGTDFRGSNITGIQAHPADLKGAVVSSQQTVEFATMFATLLGMQIEDA